MNAILGVAVLAGVTAAVIASLIYMPLQQAAVVMTVAITLGMILMERLPWRRR